MNLKLAVAVLSVLAPIVGFGLIALGWLQTSDMEARGFGMLFFLPPTAGVAWVLGVAALLLQRRPVAAAVLTLVAVLAFYGVWYGLALSIRSTETGVAILLAMIAVIGLAGIRFVVQPARRRPPTVA